MSSNAQYVGCYCGWRGRRTYVSCECDFACGHTGYGYCPKCNGGVRTVAWMRECAAIDAKFEAWAATPQGKAAMSVVTAPSDATPNTEAPATGDKEQGDERPNTNAGEARCLKQ